MVYRVFAPDTARHRLDRTSSWENLLTLDNEYPIWAQIACDGHPADQDWRAPGWLDKWPADLPPKALLSAARVGRLDANRTGRVLKEIANQIKERLAPVQKSALDGLRVRFAQGKQAARQAATAEPIVEPQQEPRAAKQVQLKRREQGIWNVIQRMSKGRQYCREEDGVDIRIQKTGVWRGAPPTYTAAYDAGKPWRHRIEDEKCRIKRRAMLAKLATE